MKEFLKRILGYFGRDKRKNIGPSLLGMESAFHHDIPDAETINKAVKEAKDTALHKS
ncbi:MAG: hypothetical protein K2X86_08645 [Cytophagaceae bacterium]|nr:hypothetical protein [Cytophagaceae bacterium]